MPSTIMNGLGDPTVSRSVLAVSLLTDKLGRLTRRDGYFLAACGVVALVSWQSLRALAETAFGQEQNSHTLLVLPVVMILLSLERSRTDISAAMDVRGFLLFAIALGVSVVARRYVEPLNHSDALSLSIMSIVIAWIALAVLTYGLGVLRRRAFLVLFLFLLVPIPSILLDPLIRGLQEGSTWASQALFMATGVPVSREGFVLLLPKINIEVAAECSGIRSTMMLILTSLVLGHLFLRSPWRQAVLLVSTVLITVVKNALRIYTLSMLAMYVDHSWIDGKFHHVYGGSLFFALAVGMVIVVLDLLRRSKRTIGLAQQDRDRLTVT